MASISELKSIASFKLGFASSNQYMVKLPTFRNQPISNEELNVLCSQAQIPGRQILTADRNIGNHYEKVHYAYGYPDVSLSFYVMNDYGVRNYFEYWMNKILFNQDTAEVGYNSNSTGPVTIFQLRKPLIGFNQSGGLLNFNLGLGGGIAGGAKLLNAFPTTITSIDRSNNLDGLVQYTTTFSYRRYEDVRPSGLFGAEFSVNF